MPTIPQELLLRLGLYDFFPFLYPAVSITATKETPGKQKRDPVLEIMIGKNMVLKIFFQPDGLHIQAPGNFRAGRFITMTYVELYPVNNPQGDRVRFPCILAANRVGSNPVLNQKQTVIFRDISAHKIIEVMEIISPQFRHIRRPPVYL